MANAVKPEATPAILPIEDIETKSGGEDVKKPTPPISNNLPVEKAPSAGASSDPLFMGHGETEKDAAADKMNWDVESLQEHLKHFFDHFPNVETFHFTSDGTAFELLNNATNHGLTLIDKRVVAIDRKDVIID